VGQEVDYRLAILAGQVMADIGLATQLDGDRAAAQRNREALAEALLQLPPDQAEAFIERLPARVGGQQAGLGAR
jgi:DNA-directed RNA polymerase specialized sigma24 family protein